MRHIATLILATISCYTGAYGSTADMATTDTVVVITNAKDITVSTGNGSMVVQVDLTDQGETYKYKATATHRDTITNDWNLDLPFAPRKHSKFKATVLPRVSVDWGAIIDESTVYTSNGICQGALEVGQVSWWPTLNTSLSLGVGMQWSQYSFKGQTLLACHDGALSFIDAPAEAAKVSSNINNFSWIFPLRLYQRIYRDFGFTVGAIAKFNTYATANTSYKIDDNRYKESFKGLHQRPLTYELTASLVIGWLEAYVRYSPCHVFESGYGPTFKTWSVGVAVAF